MRLPDWPQRLDAEIARHASEQNTYGAFVCALFAADIVLAVTGEDLGAPYRDRDFTAMQAARILSGFGSLEDLVTTMLKREPKPPAFAGRGDIVIGAIDLGEGVGDAIGVCTGTRCAFRTETGLRFYPRRIARLAWSVG